MKIERKTRRGNYNAYDVAWVVPAETVETEGDAEHAVVGCWTAVSSHGPAPLRPAMLSGQLLTVCDYTRRSDSSGWVVDTFEIMRHDLSHAVQSERYSRQFVSACVSSVVSQVVFEKQPWTCMSSLT